MSISRLLVFASVAIASAAAPRAVLAASALRAQQDSERVIPNDNRAPAGVLRDGVLRLRLEARLASWHPDGDDAPGALVPAFAETNGPARIPGPLIRVPAGTEVEVVLRNLLAGATLDVFGLGDRVAMTSSPQPERFRLAPGETRTVRFRLVAPGTYYYWGTTTGRSFVYRTKEDAQLTGAIIVDPPGARAADRVLVIGMWTDTTSFSWTPRTRLLSVINGLSWPHTERLRYSVGDSARWRVINSSTDGHPMHLHGFYFAIEGRGDGMVDSLTAPDLRPRVFTENLRGGETMDMAWVPERAGNWLFHCHIPEHFAHRGPLGMPPPVLGRRSGNHATKGMGGLVMGIIVTPARARTSPPPGESRRRHIRLLVRRNAGGSDSLPFFGFALHVDGAPPRPDSGLHYGPPLVLTRGQPVAISVVNTLAEPTSVHWHGIELESFFDGVAGFSGDSARPAPMIAAGDSFVVLFTPPRAGTFIYHTHVNEERQVLAGLVGPIIVLEPGQRYDPTVDHAVLITSPASFEDQKRMVLVNSVDGPGPLTLRAGVPNRIRFVQLTMRRPRVLLQLLRDGKELPWRPVAKDAQPVPTARVDDFALRQVALGETLDLEITPDTPGELRLDVRIGGSRDNQLLASVPVRVVP